mgnify:FL=1
MPRVHVATVITAAATLLASCAGGQLPADGAAVVVGVDDGDTIDVRVAGRTERVRLTGIDTPETLEHDSPVECYGPEATAYTRSLLPPGTRVTIERDVVGRDDYGRLLGYVHRSDGLFVNHEIIRQGYAVPLSIEPNSTHAARFAAAARSAEADDVGLWAACTGR